MDGVRCDGGQGDPLDTATGEHAGHGHEGNAYSEAEHTSHVQGRDGFVFAVQAGEELHSDGGPDDCVEPEAGGKHHFGAFVGCDLLSAALAGTNWPVTPSRTKYLKS